MAQRVKFSCGATLSHFGPVGAICGLSAGIFGLVVWWFSLAVWLWMIKGELVVKSFCMVIFAELGARLRPDAHNHAGTGSSFQFELFLIKNATVGFECTESTILDLLATLLRQSGPCPATP